MKILTGLLFGLCLLTQTVFAATPTLDASAPGTKGYAGTNSTTITLSTTSTNDIIVLLVYNEVTVTPSASVSSVSGGSLTWRNRMVRADTYSSGCFSSHTCFGDSEIWWAFSSGTQSSATITINFSKSIDNGTAVIFGVNGAASQTSPFDTNVSLPASTANITSTANNVTMSSVTTSQAHDLIFYFLGQSFQSSSYSGNCSSWTFQSAVNEIAGTNIAFIESLTQGVSTTQSSLTTIGYATGCGTRNQTGWTLIADAISGDTPVTNSGQLPLVGLGD